MTLFDINSNHRLAMYCRHHKFLHSGAQVFHPRKGRCKIESEGFEGRFSTMPLIRWNNMKSIHQSLHCFHRHIPLRLKYHFRNNNRLFLEKWTLHPNNHIKYDLCFPSFLQTPQEFRTVSPWKTLWEHLHRLPLFKQYRSHQWSDLIRCPQTEDHQSILESLRPRCQWRHKLKNLGRHRPIQRIVQRNLTRKCERWKHFQE